MKHNFKGTEPQIAEDVFLAPGSHVVGDTHIGEGSSVWFNTVLRGDVHFIRVGKKTNIQDNTVCHVTNAKNPCIIGDRVTVGHSCIIHGATLKDQCLIGMGSTILDRAEIGENTLVGAGSLVTEGKKIPSGVLVMGRPAKVIRELSDEEIKSLADSAEHYSQLGQVYREEK